MLPISSYDGHAQKCQCIYPKLPFNDVIVFQITCCNAPQNMPVSNQSRTDTSLTSRFNLPFLKYCLYPLTELPSLCLCENVLIINWKTWFHECSLFQHGLFQVCSRSHTSIFTCKIFTDTWSVGFILLLYMWIKCITSLLYTSENKIFSQKWI